MTVMDKDFLSIFAAATCLKFLFIPFYYSTDFEVHRNWMAITYSCNITNWYLESTSAWTLDYPPLFAWFEYNLSHLAKYFDEKMLDVKNLNYASTKTVFFMRFSVILADIFYAYAVNKIYYLIQRKQFRSDDPWIKPEVIIAMLLLWNPGLLLVDHIHFQYNGFLTSLLFLSVAAVIQEKYLESAVWFTLLLNFKHIYLYFAPAFFIYLLKYHCFENHKRDGSVDFRSFSVRRLLELSFIVVGIFLLSFGPFLYAGQLKQVLKQIFPVKRGLTHAYWAPNFWALYNFLDRVLMLICINFFGFKSYNSDSMTKGLVQEYNHAILPSVSVIATVVLTLLSIAPGLWILWKKPKSSLIFIQCLITCAFGSFLFGYHVHEKAIMMITLPLAIISSSHQQMAKSYIFLSTIAHFSLFPLLNKAGETPIKVLLLLLHLIYAYTGLNKLQGYWSKMKLTNNDIINGVELSFLIGILCVEIFNFYGLKMLELERLSFLPLMLVSTYCAIGVLYSYIKHCLISYNEVNYKLI